MTKGAEDDVSLCALTGLLPPWLTKGAEDNVSLCMLPDSEFDG